MEVEIPVVCAKGFVSTFTNASKDVCLESLPEMRSLTQSLVGDVIRGETESIHCDEDMIRR